MYAPEKILDFRGLFFLFSTQKNYPKLPRIAIGIFANTIPVSKVIG